MTPRETLDLCRSLAIETAAIARLVAVARRRPTEQHAQPLTAAEVRGVPLCEDFSRASRGVRGLTVGAGVGAGTRGAA